MAEGLGAFLQRDLRQALDAGFRRTSPVSPDGGRWLVRWMWINLFVGLVLFLFCGYQAGFVRVNALAGTLSDGLWQLLTLLGDERVAFALSLFFARRYPRVFWSLAVAALLGVAFTHSLKPALALPRPPAVLEAGSFSLIGPGLRTESFPSGHSVTAAIFFGVWVYSVRRSWLRPPLILLAVAAGLSRVALGVHWPLDVAAGLAGGVAAAGLGVSLARRGERIGLLLPVHVAFVVVAAAMAVSLLVSDGGYGAVAHWQRLLGLAALGYAAAGYLIGPLLRWSRLRRPRP